MRHDMLKIAVCGHRELEDSRELDNALDAACRLIRETYPHRDYRVLSCLAEGADRTLARILMEQLPASLTVVLPLSEAEYLEDFAKPESKEEYLSLRQQAAAVTEPSETTPRPEAYKRANATLLAQGDLLIAAWNGRDPSGPGGTGETVQEARRRGMPVLWIHTERMTGSCLLTTEHWPVPEEQAFLSSTGEPEPGKRKKGPAKRESRYTSWLYEARWIMLGTTWAVFLAMGIAGFYRYAGDNGIPASPGDLLYLTLQLIAMESGMPDGQGNWMLEASRFGLPLLAAVTLLQALAELFYEQLQWVRLWHLRNHYIVAGTGPGSSILIDGLLQAGKRVVSLAAKEDARPSRSWRGKITLKASGPAEDWLLRARIRSASHLVCFCEEDAENLQLALCASRLCSDCGRDARGTSLTCLVHLNSPELYSLLKGGELSAEGNAGYRIELFHPYARAARSVLQENPDWNACLAGQKPHYHLLVVGAGHLALHLVREAVFEWAIRNRGGRLSVTVMDPKADALINTFAKRQPDAHQYAGLFAETLDLGNPREAESILGRIHARQPVDAAYLCTEDTVAGLQGILSLLAHKHYRHLELWIAVPEEASLLQLLQRTVLADEDRERIHPFELYGRACAPEQILGGIHQQLAESLHANYLKTLPVGERGVTWQELTADEKEANRTQADRIHRLFLSVGLRIIPLQDLDALDRALTEAEVLAMARQEHELWCASKRQQGWKEGSEKDAARRTHPDLVPWERLPENEKQNQQKQKKERKKTRRFKWL